MNEYSKVYSKNTYSTIKKYLESNTYPEEITSLEWKTKKYRKMNFRDIIRRDQRFKLMSSDDSKKVNNFIKIGIGIKRKEKI